MMRVKADFKLKEMFTDDVNKQSEFGAKLCDFLRNNLYQTVYPYSIEYKYKISSEEIILYVRVGESSFEYNIPNKFIIHDSVDKVTLDMIIDYFIFNITKSLESKPIPHSSPLGDTFKFQKYSDTLLEDYRAWFMNQCNKRDLPLFHYIGYGKPFEYEDEDVLFLGILKMSGQYRHNSDIELETKWFTKPSEVRESLYAYHIIYALKPGEEISFNPELTPENLFDKKDEIFKGAVCHMKETKMMNIHSAIPGITYVFTERNQKSKDTTLKYKATLELLDKMYNKQNKEIKRFLKGKGSK